MIQLLTVNLGTPYVLVFVCTSLVFHFVNKPEKDINEDKLLSLDMGKESQSLLIKGTFSFILHGPI